MSLGESLVNGTGNIGSGMGIGDQAADIGIPYDRYFVVNEFFEIHHFDDHRSCRI